MEKLQAADKLVLEIKADAPDIQLKMMGAMMMGGDTTLQTPLKADYEKVRQFMSDSLGINLRIHAYAIEIGK